MTLRTRALGVVGLVFLGLLAAVLALVYTEVLDRFATLEHASLARDASRVQRALATQLDNLDVLAADWATWDDAYAFVANANPVFIRSNLNAESIGALRASFVAFLRRDGELVWGRWRDRATGSLEPLPDDLARHLQPGSPLVSRSEAAPSLTGIVMLRGGAVAVASRAILTSTGTGPCRGAFLLGRSLGDEEVGELARTVDLTVTAIPAAGPLPPDGAAALAEVTPGRPIHVSELGSSRIAAYQVLRDIAGHPALLLRVDEPRSIYQEGVSVARYLVGVLLLTVLAFALAMLVGLERTVLARLARLSASLRAVARSGSPSGRVQVDGVDELASLAGDINASLAGVEQAGAALRESEERYRRLIEMSPDGIMLVCDGRLAFANRRLAELLGVGEPQLLLGRGLPSLIAEEDRERAAERLRRLDRGQEIAPNAAVRLLREDGSTVETEVTAIPSSLAGRRVVQAVVRDVSGRRRLEAHVRHAQKLEAIGQLAGGLAHDFNNLLQAVLGGLEVLRRRGAAHPRHEEAVVELEEHVRRGAALARQLLLFSEREVTKTEPLDLNAVIAGASGLLRRVVRESVAIRTDLAPGPLPVVADRGQLEQVIVNLAVNASDAMPDGGELRLRSGDDGSAVWLDVADSGTGMTAEVMARIYEPFFTTKERGKGTGLGLAVVHGIIAQHGGSIAVTSRPGHGTAFRVALPRAPDPQAGAILAPEAASAPGPAPAESGARILVVEDEDGARASLVEMLELLGFEAVGVASGEEAGLLPAEPAFDLLLTDVILPGVHGVQLAQGLKDRWRELRVIVMSGYTEDEALKIGVDRGTTRYLQKPFSLAVLEAEVAAALADRAE